MVFGFQITFSFLDLYKFFGIFLLKYDLIILIIMFKINNIFNLRRYDEILV